MQQPGPLDRDRRDAAVASEASTVSESPLAMIKDDVRMAWESSWSEMLRALEEQRCAQERLLVQFGPPRMMPRLRSPKPPPGFRTPLFVAPPRAPQAKLRQPQEAASASCDAADAPVAAAALAAQNDLEDWSKLGETTASGLQEASSAAPFAEPPSQREAVATLVVHRSHVSTQTDQTEQTMAVVVSSKPMPERVSGRINVMGQGSGSLRAGGAARGDSASMLQRPSSMSLGYIFKNNRSAADSDARIDRATLHLGQSWGIDLIRVQELLELGKEQHGFFNAVKVYILQGIMWWAKLREPQRKSKIAAFIANGSWIAVVSMMIFANSILMGFVTDTNFNDAWQATVRSQNAFIEVVEALFVLFFMFDLGLRLWVHRLFFFVNEDAAWNLFDFLIVGISAYDLISTTIVRDLSRSNVTFMRSLRVLRTVRVLRMIRIFKYASSLRQMLQSVLGSFQSLFWAFVLLFVTFYLFSLATVQWLASFLASNEGQQAEPQLKDEIVEHFGSVFQTMMSYHMATSGGKEWAMYYEVLLRASGMAAALFVLVVAFTQIALLNIMTGVFVESAMKLAQPDRATMALEQRKVDLKDAAELRELLAGLDVDCTNTIGWEEFRQVASDPLVASMLAVMGLDIKDAALMFHMLCTSSDSEEVEVDALLNACLKMKGPATSLDLQAVAFKTDVIGRQLADINRKLRDTGLSSRDGAKS
mmetsp:Transcript_95620/g.276243  ORF Transcript_95620/g.276243 Transcript_95620/m.276243 type:complete len:704 (+) Transcript_95620:64-2175(+)